MAGKPQVIALEEHYLDAEVKPHITGIDVTGGRRSSTRLDDVGRAASPRWTRPASTSRCCRTARPRCRRSPMRNSRCGSRAAPTTGWPRRSRAHPDRFAAFAALPTPDPKAAADELERTVTRLGFKGAMIHGLTNGLFIDDKRFWPIFERAAGARRAALHAPRDPASGGDRGLLQGLCRAVSDHPARRLGLHGRDRDPGHPPHSERRVRHIPAA